jgi:hypothetical protein
MGNEMKPRPIFLTLTAGGILWLLALVFISLTCSGCISSTVRKPDGTTHHFGSIAQNVQRLEYHADGSFVAEGVDSATPTREVVKTAGIISIWKTLTSGAVSVAGDAVEKIE